MRQAALVLILGAGALVFAGSATAQRGWGYRDNYGVSPYRGGLIDNVIGDLERTRSYRRVDGHERRHFEQARRDLERFQHNLRNGRFDHDRIDSAIENIEHLVDSDQMHPRDRQILARDLRALRDFRADGAYGRRGRY